MKIILAGVAALSLSAVLLIRVGVLSRRANWLLYKGIEASGQPADMMKIQRLWAARSRLWLPFAASVITGLGLLLLGFMRLMR